MILLLLILSGAAAWAQPTQLSVVRVTPTQAVIQYKAPSAGTCTITSSVESDYTPLDIDIDPGLYANANQDLSRPETIVQGLWRTVIIGKTGAIEEALDGNYYSRALEADVAHYIEVNCGGPDRIVATLPTPAMGTTRGYRPFADSANPGKFLNPTYSYTDKNQTFIDPYSGVKLLRFSMPRDHNRDLPAQQFTGVEMGDNWTAASAVLANDANYASYSGTTQDWLYFRTNITNWGANLGEIPYVDYLNLTVSGYCAGAPCSTVSERIVDVQFTYDGVNWSPVQQITLPDGVEGAVSVCGTAGATCTPGEMWGLPIPERQELRWATGKLFNSGSSTVATFTTDGNCDLLRAGDQFYVAGNITTVSSLDCVSDPKTVTLNGAFNLTEPAAHDGWPFAYAVGHHTNAKLGFRIRKNSTNSAAEHQIQYVSLYVGRSDRGKNTSGGFHQRCQTLPTANGNHLCVFGNRMYSFDPETGEVILMGSNFRSTSGDLTAVLLGETFGSASVTWSNQIPGRVYTTATENSSGKRVLLVCDITQSDIVENPWPDGASGIPQVSANCFNMTPSSAESDLAALVAAFDSNYDSTLYPNFLVSAVTSDDHLCIVSRRSNQDTYGYIAVFDLGNGQVLGSGGTGSVVAGNYMHAMAGSSALHVSTRWAGLHTVFDPSDSPDHCVWQPNVIMKDATVGNQSFYIQLAQSLNAVSGGTTQTIAITTTWNPTVMGTQPSGWGAGDPVSDCPFGGCVGNIDNISNDYYHGPLRPGDVLRCGSSTTIEYLEVVSVNSKTSIVVRRGIGTPDVFYNPKAWFGGTRCSMSYTSGLERPDEGWAGVAWDFLDSPVGTDVNAFKFFKLTGGGHAAFLENYANSGPEYVGYVIQDGLSNSQIPLDKNDPQATQVRRQSPFTGATSVNVGVCTQGHPSIPVVRDGRLTATDSHPFRGGVDCFNGPTSTNPFVLVDWPIYKWTPAQRYPKHFDLINGQGNYALRNVSGPGSAITTSLLDWFTICEVLVANECYPGSLAREIYVSAPALRPNLPYCFSSPTTRDDLCTGDLGANNSSVVEYNTPSTLDSSLPLPRNRSYRELTKLFYPYKQIPETHNVKMLPGFQFAYYEGHGGPRPEGYLIKLPSEWNPDTVNRAAFVPLLIRVNHKPAGATRLLVKFGYNEGFQCLKNNRAEACYTAAPAIIESDPFLWESELQAFSGIDVSSGSSWTITIPALPERTGRYQLIWRDSAGNTVFAGPVSAF